WRRQPESPPRFPHRRMRQARAQSQLVEDLLDVSRIITGNLRLNVQPVAPAAFVDAGIEAVTPAADAKGVVIRKEFSPGVAAVAGDSARLQQVVWNLLSNAVKFTPRGGEVTVRLEPVDAGVRITIADTGEGIRPEFLPYVFDRFRQQDGRTSRRHGGLGLGLAIVRHLVELHGGTVRADSGGEGRGATFEVVLPVGGAAQPPAPPIPRAASAGAQPVREPPALAGLKVLLVDDEPDTLKLLELVLSRAGAQVAIADSAEAALQRLQQERPDVLVSDIAMPGTDGYELIRRLRQRGERVAAAALTAYARPQDRERALQSGYSAHIAKPVEPAELLAVIASLSGRRDAGSADAGCTSTRDASGEDAAAQ
ncbi:MAG TPA: ATP-binding protein, partial [Burkholderiaceae bacterium]|nr:ATP-binding protein [Burkholderiaceae bacterium]